MVCEVGVLGVGFAWSVYFEVLYVGWVWYNMDVFLGVGLGVVFGWFEFCVCWFVCDVCIWFGGWVLFCFGCWAFGGCWLEFVFGVWCFGFVWVCLVGWFGFGWVVAVVGWFTWCSLCLFEFWMVVVGVLRCVNFILQWVGIGVVDLLGLGVFEVVLV